MRNGISFTISSRDRQRLQAIVADPKSPQKHVWRVRIVLLSGEGLGTSAIMAATGKSKTCVWRWQERFMHAGVDGLLRDKSRPPGKAPVAPERVAASTDLALDVNLAGLVARRRQAQMRPHGAGAAEAVRPVDRGAEGERGDRADARNAHQPPAGLVMPGDIESLAGQAGKLPQHRLQYLKQWLDQRRHVSVVAHQRARDRQRRLVTACRA